MKPILIHIHLYYPELWSELRELLTNDELPPYDLYITQVEEHEQVRAEALQLCPTARILTVENRGYDVWPFLHVLKQVNLDDYLYCIKLHTKRDLPRYASLCSRSMPYPYHGSLWRKYLFSAFLPNHLRKVMLAFRKDAKLGMVADFRVILHRDVGDPEAYNECMTFVRSQGWKLKRFSFVAGSMFICRAKLLKPFQALPYTAEDFDKPTEEHPRTLAHVLERYLGAIIQAQGYELRDAFSPCSFLRLMLRRIFAFVYQHKITKSNRRLIKICSIPVYFRKLKETQKQRED